MIFIATKKKSLYLPIPHCSNSKATTKYYVPLTASVNALQWIRFIFIIFLDHKNNHHQS